MEDWVLHTTSLYSSVSAVLVDRTLRKPTKRVLRHANEPCGSLAPIPQTACHPRYLPKNPETPEESGMRPAFV